MVQAVVHSGPRSAQIWVQRPRAPLGCRLYARLRELAAGIIAATARTITATSSNAFNFLGNVTRA